MWNLVLVRLDTVLVSMQDRCSVSRETYHRLRNHFGRTQWNSLVTWVMWNLILVRLETVLVIVKDRCRVCAKCTKGLEIILDASDGTPR